MKTSELTPAQKVRNIIDSMGWTVSNAARLLKVNRVSVHRWLLQAQVDDGDVVPGDSHRQPDEGRVLLAELVADREDGF